MRVGRRKTDPQTAMPIDPESYVWRTGRKVGRTIYCVVGDEPGDEDPLIGVMDTPLLAEEAVRAHNLDLAIRNGR